MEKVIYDYSKRAEELARDLREVWVALTKENAISKSKTMDFTVLKQRINNLQFYVWNINSELVAVKNELDAIKNELDATSISEREK